MVKKIKNKKFICGENMKDVADEIEELCDMLVDNYLLTSAIIIVNEKVEDGTQICVSRKGNAYEQIGMLRDVEYRLTTGDDNV